ncbi:MAG: hypothetical protein RL237_521 [Actinomycetota bacterium]
MPGLLCACTYVKTGLDSSTVLGKNLEMNITHSVNAQDITNTPINILIFLYVPIMPQKPIASMIETKG